ncbi:hypothetical protein NL676_014609 [Syzygium grande]|nr:hypothetical protein NL676_014609 [Syzygium grande]
MTSLQLQVPPNARWELIKFAPRQPDLEKKTGRRHSRCYFRWKYRSLATPIGRTTCRSISSRRQLAQIPFPT